MNLFWAVVIWAAVIALSVTVVFAIGYEFGWKAALRRGRKARKQLAADVQEAMNENPLDGIHGDVTRIPYQGCVR